MTNTGDMADATFRYDRATVWLHWATVVLVVLLWTSAQTIDFFPRGDGRTPMRSTHILLGLILIGVVAARLIWRNSNGGKARPTYSGLLEKGAHGLHHLLLALLVAAVVLGVSNVWVRGDTFFVLKIPEFDPGNRALRGLVGDLHAYATNAIVILAGVHAVAALYHHYILRDSVLRRMLPR